MVTKTAAMVLLASALATPLAAHSAAAANSPDDSITIEVEVPARTASPTLPPIPTATPSASPTPSVTPTASVAPTPSATTSARPTPGATPAPDADRPGAGALPATGAQIAPWAAALGLVALVAGLAIHARRRSRA